MNASTLRGLTVLALLCLLPRAGAFQLILTGQTIEGRSSTGGSSTPITTVWTFDRYTGSEIIQDVSVRVSLITYGYVHELNIFDTPQNWSVSAGNIATVYVDDRSQLRSNGASTPMLTVAPHAGITLPFIWVQEFSFRFAGPTEVDYFIGSGQSSIIVANSVSMQSRWSGGTAWSEARYTVTYNAPDVGGTAGLLTFSALGCVLLHQRRRMAPR